MEEIACRECFQPIPAGARKCTKCQSFQDWRRPIFVWSGVVTAMLALVPLWTGAYSLFTIAFPEPAHVEAEITACSSSQLIATLHNTGKLRAVVGLPRVEHFYDGQWHKFDYTYTLDEDKSVADPDDIDVIDLSPPIGSFNSDPDQPCRLKAIFPVHEKRGETRKVEATCTCATS